MINHLYKQVLFNSLLAKTKKLMAIFKPLITQASCLKSLDILPF
ncbi:hypothetical protein ADICYQ_1122 [Cyclobacterium qasimii M12-11B]|uniref:Uncharacterized protein n=1 Tax=Cyclobacterium qasimii M12-11B TaxID=641524 RepID=S7VIW8_9BACT|nr:hypothetical protein ADICYQ_1122 [Cyclobacterium qasimii M12-11B]